MLSVIDRAYIGLRIRGRNFVETLKNEERGSSEMVAIIAVIAVVLVVAGIFSKQLTSMVKNVFNSVTEFVGGSEGTKLEK